MAHIPCIYAYVRHLYKINADLMAKHWDILVTKQFLKVQVPMVQCYTQ